VSWPDITAFQTLKFIGFTDGLTGGILPLPDGLTEGEARNPVYLVHSPIPSVGGRRTRVPMITQLITPTLKTA